MNAKSAIKFCNLVVIVVIIALLFGVDHINDLFALAANLLRGL